MEKRMNTWLLYLLIFGLTCIDQRKCESFSREFSVDDRKYCKRTDSDFICNVIPRDIPAGVKSVHLINIDIPSRKLEKGRFSSENWGKVKQLKFSAENTWIARQSDKGRGAVDTFDSMCFEGLKSLEILSIEISSHVQFTPETLMGLHNLKLLDLSGCRRFSVDNLIAALKDPQSVPNIRSLNLSLFNSYLGGVKLNDEFFKLISEKQLKELDISSIQALFMNLTSFQENCKSLEYLNISQLMLNDYVRDGYMPHTCPNLKFIDASYIILPSDVIPDRGPQVKIAKNKSFPFDLKWTWVKSLSNVEYINLSGITPKQTRYILDNVTVYLLGVNRFNLKTIISKDNNFERLNMKIVARKSKLESVNFSNCNIRFLHPGVLSSFTLLHWIDLSKNRLNDMIMENAGLFGKLFRNLTQLTYVNLASNGLTQLPLNIFKSNSLIEVIDLSNNLLSQVTFDVENLEKVRMIDLTRNVIKVLDDTSMARLNSLIIGNYDRNFTAMNISLMLNDNPISCSNCESLSFINWLIHSELPIEGFSAMKCRNAHAENVNIDQKVIDNLQAICNRPRVIIFSVVASVCVIITALILVFLVRLHRRRRRYKTDMEDRIALIRQGAESHQFIVFLSFSSRDDNFIYKYVYDPLNKHLQNMTGERRDLVCEGDRDFQLGRPIHDQISVLLKKSSVVVALLTDNYCESVHCRNEFDQAFMLEKPIVLMIKDEVDTGLMTPLIRDLYEKRTRVLWMWENGQYVLKTSWENVSTSIVELVDSK